MPNIVRAVLWLWGACMIMYFGTVLLAFSFVLLTRIFS